MGLLSMLRKEDQIDYDDNYDDRYYDEEADSDYDDYYEEEPKEAVKNVGAVYNVDQIGVTVILSAPTSTADCSIIIDNLKKNNVISLSLERADEETSQRIIDLLSGAAYAVHATIQKISIDNDKSYLITPGPVKVDNSLMRNIDKGSRDILNKVSFGNR